MTAGTQTSGICLDRGRQRENVEERFEMSVESEETSMSLHGGRAALIVTVIALPLSGGSVPRSAERDRAHLEAIERLWLGSEHDHAALERILADDFLHPVSAGVFLTKRQHIDWAVGHPATPDRRARFDQLQVRLYGDVGVVTGMVIATEGNGDESRTVFTDVFVRRHGEWQAVNAQENSVAPPPAR
jgi:hypothetical protein